MMPSRIPEMINLFSKFRIMGARELQIVVGDHLSRVQANRYLRTLIELSMIERRTHPRFPLTTYEATSKLLQYAIPEKAKDFRAQRDVDLRHRVKCTEVLAHLCRYEFVSGVASEHELSSTEVERFCFERTPDGIAQLTRPGRPPIEVAIEVELESKGEPRIDALLSLYEKTFRNEKLQCKGLIVVTPSEFCFGVYQKLIERRPLEFRERVRVSNRIDLSDLDSDVLGRRLPSAYLNRFLSCFSKRLVKQNIAEYLSDRSGLVRIKTHRAKDQSSDGSAGE